MSVGLISRCGIYCGACYIYRAFKDRGRLLETTAERVVAAREEIRCNGCLGPVEDLWRNCKKCEIRACLQERELVFCYECLEFDNSSCSKYEHLREFCSKRAEDIKEALERIKAEDADVWLMEQDEKWRCAACRESMCWAQETCHHCGQPAQRV